MRRILIADDEDHIRLLVNLTLEDDEVEIVEARDGIEALRLLESEMPDLALLDWMMPGMSGIDVVESARKQARTAAIPIILLTAKARPEDCKVALAAGAARFLTKPFSPQELLETVQEVLSE